MSDLSIRADGAEDLARTLSDAGGAFADLSDPASDAAAAVLGAVDAPRLTGFLESTVAVEVDALGFTLTATADYAVFVHARDPFLSDALQQRADAVVDAYTDHAADALDAIHA